MDTETLRKLQDIEDELDTMSLAYTEIEVLVRVSGKSEYGQRISGSLIQLVNKRYNEVIGRLHELIRR